MRRSVIKLNTRPQVLIISGLDPSGGAGVQADIQAVTALGAHPLPVLSCLTIQDTRNVYDAIPVDKEIVRQQLERLASDCTIHVIKTGALGNADVVDVVCEFADRHPDLPLIVDPVVKAAGGGDLADQALINRMVTELFPRAEMITPNGIELAMLARNEDPSGAAEILLAQGCRSVLATGGHDAGPIITNRLYRAGQPAREWQVHRTGSAPEGTEYHGTGCTLAAAIAAGRATGLSSEEAIEQAQQYVAEAVSRALQVGQGQPVPDRSVRWKK